MPHDIRRNLGSSTVEIDVKGGEVMLGAVASAAGMPAKYGEGTEPAPLHEIREKVCEEFLRDRTRDADTPPERPSP